MSAAAWAQFRLSPNQEAHTPPEGRGVGRDRVRLLVSTPEVDCDREFSDLPEIVHAGDLLLVNDSATLPASLPAHGRLGAFDLHLSTHYGNGLWVAEPRWGPATPGPLALLPGESITVAGLPARWVLPFPGIPRLGFVQFDSDPTTAIASEGRPIRYGYVPEDYPLESYQTIFARHPGSAEMPSAARPFTQPLVDALRANHVEFAALTLHAGVSSLEVEGSVRVGDVLYPEPFEVPAPTVAAVERTRAAGGRVIAVGTTVVRAIESATDSRGLRPARGFTRLALTGDRPIRTVDGLLTGFHTSSSSHLALLSAFAGDVRVERAYRAALSRGYLWHEFGDSHLILRHDEAASPGGEFAGLPATN